VAAVGGTGYLVYQFAVRGPFFRLSGPEAIEVVGSEHVPAAAVAERFAEDAGGSVFTVPLEARRQSLEGIAWVESASVQRVLPGRLRIYVRERTPVAFLRQGTSLELVDAQGVILPVPEGASYAFPVLTGLPETLAPEERRTRVGFYQEFVADLDREAKGYSAQVSEVDLSDADNLRASLLEPDGTVWLYFGRDRYQEKFEAYLQHRSVWQKNGEAVRAVDLRYRGQIVLNPEPPAREATR
jgi:cell division protein FtsQ